jgi:hypothetical protein
MPIGVISTTMKLPEHIISIKIDQLSFRAYLHIQLVAVPNAAPLFFIDRELISGNAISFGRC